ncbi:MAG: DUF5060 domain-containing protein [Candidatus Aenigmatarchaeota archaeon]
MKKYLISLIVFFILSVFVYALPTINSLVFNTQNVKKYEKFEITVDLVADYTNPYDPDEVDLSCVFTSPSNKNWNIYGFYDGNNWRIRFSPNEVGSWQYKIILKDKTGETQTQTYTFECIPSEHHGWLKVAANSRYLMYDDGTTFYGVGYCRAWNPMAIPFEEVKNYGINIIVIWIGPPWMGMIENTTKGIGVYDQSICFPIDNYVQEAEKNGIHIILVLWPHDALRIPGQPWPNGNWSKNAYSLITTPEGFYSDTGNVWNYQKKLYRYIIARWGYSRAIGIWNIISEINGTTGYTTNPQAAENWCSRVHQFFKENDPYKKPTCGSKSGDQFWNNGYNIFDLSEIHTYKDRTNATSVADTIISYTRQMWTGFTKPNFVGEFGTDNQNLQPQHLHNAIWAGLAAGACITPLDWNDGGSWGDMTEDMLQHMKILYDFVKDIDFVNNNFQPASVAITPSGDAIAMRSSKYVFGWIRKTTALTERILTIQGLLDGVYEAKFFDTWTGEYFLTIQSSSTYGFLSISLPSLSKSDFAFKVYLKGTSQDSTSNNNGSDNQIPTINLEGKLIELLPLDKNPVKINENKEIKIKFLVNIQVPSKVKVTIYDLNMNIVKELTNGWLKVSHPYQEFIWDIKDKNNKEVSPGIYIYKIDVINDYKVKDTKLNKIMIIR